MKTVTRLRIRGRVQGVGYRAWFAGNAERSGLSGWVRNRHDGSVEALVIGAVESLHDLISASRRGPRAARVTDIEVSEESVDEAAIGPGFEVAPTA